MTWKHHHFPSRDYPKPVRPDPLLAHHVYDGARVTFKVVKLDTEDFRWAEIEVVEADGLLPNTGRSVSAGIGSQQRISLDTPFIKRAESRFKEVLGGLKIGTLVVVKREKHPIMGLPIFVLQSVQHPGEEPCE